MDKSIFCIAKTEAEAQKIVARLMSQGFQNQQISFIYSNKDNKYSSNSNEYTHRESHLNTDANNSDFRKKDYIERDTKAPEGAATGGTIGGIIGGSLGLLAGLGAIAIPGLGPFIAAGPLMGALSGSGIGGGIGLLLGSLVGLGIPEDVAKKYQDHLSRGEVLISVRTSSDEEMNKAHKIMSDEGASDITKTIPKSVV